MKNHKHHGQKDQAQHHPNGSLPDAVTKGASAYGHNFALMQSEGLRFAQQRLEENLHVVQEIGKCRSLPDLFAVQQRWFTDMTKAYSEEWQRYGEMINDMMRDAGSAALDSSQPSNGQATKSPE